MISQLKLHNFKAFEDLDIELRPITLLLGPNNSGKSSIIAALRILVQTLESNDNSIPILLNGILGDFGTYRDIVHRNNIRRQIKIHFAITTNGRDYRTWLSEDKPNLDSREKEKLGLSLTYSYRSKRREIILQNLEIIKNNNPILTTEYSHDSERQLISRIGDIEIPSPYKSSLTRYYRMENYLPRNLFLQAHDRESSFDDFIHANEIRERFRDISRTGARLYRNILDIEYLGAMRIPPARTYLFTGERRRRIGATGDRAGNILVMDSARGGAKSKNILGLVSERLQIAGIASKLSIDTISDRHYEIRVEHPITKETQNLADVGYGNSQVIPVLVGGYNLTSGSTYMVEEPEIHLHPRAQSELGDFMLSLYMNGIQSIFETHSEYLVLRLQQHVANQIIPPEHIRIYYIYPKNEQKIAVPLELDNKGKFINEWPEGFFPERLEESAKLSRIRFKSELNTKDRG